MSRSHLKVFMAELLLAVAAILISDLARRILLCDDTLFLYRYRQCWLSAFMLIASWLLRDDNAFASDALIPAGNLRQKMLFYSALVMGLSPFVTWSYIRTLNAQYDGISQYFALCSDLWLIALGLFLAVAARFYQEYHGIDSGKLCRSLLRVNCILSKALCYGIILAFILRIAFNLMGDGTISTILECLMVISSNGLLIHQFGYCVLAVLLLQIVIPFVSARLLWSVNEND